MQVITVRPSSRADRVSAGDVEEQDREEFFADWPEFFAGDFDQEPSLN